MKLVTLAEAKDRLSIDFDTKDNEITIMTNAIESYLLFATGLDAESTIIAVDGVRQDICNLAKEYILLKLYLDYYGAHTDIDDQRLTQYMKQLQVLAHYE